MTEYAVASKIANDFQNTVKPNILLVMTDQQNINTIHDYGNKTIETPNIHRIAEDGVIFERAYTSCPLCAPARSSLFSGMYIHETGIPVNDDDSRMIALEDSIQTVGDVLNKGGYECGYFGKWHMGREEYPQHGFENGWFVHLRNSYENWLDRTGRFTFPRGVTSYDRRGVVPYELAHDTEVTNRSIEFIKNKREKPFFCVCSLRAPHDPYIGPFSEYYTPEDIPIPPTLHEKMERKPAAQKNSFAKKAAEAIGLDDEQQFRKTAAGYWGLVHLVDLNIGRILDALERYGLKENTIVIFTSDHGDMMGGHGMIMKGPFMYEETTRIPLIIRNPFLKTKDKKVHELVSIIDIAPTIIDHAELKTPGAMRGRSLRYLIEKESGYAWRDSIFMQHYESYTERAPIWNVTTKDWKYNYYFGDRDELYNLAEDPSEERNLAQDEAYRKHLFEMRERLMDWSKRSDAPSLSDILRLAGNNLSPGIFQ